MNKKYIQIGIVAFASIGAIYGGYKLVKYIMNKYKFNGDKIISEGDKGDEAKTIQQTLNNIISDASKTKSSDATKETRRKAIASLNPLTVNGIFDADSVSVLSVIMGKNSASYNDVKDKRIQFSKNYGMSNPYAKK
jgi:hypothetical protein